MANATTKSVTILGTVIAAPVARMTKGSDTKPAKPVQNFKIYEKIAGADGKLVDSQRVIEVGHFNFPTNVKLDQGDLVRVTCQGVESEPWSRDGKSGMNHRATTNGKGVFLLRAKAA